LLKSDIGRWAVFNNNHFGQIDSISKDEKHIYIDSKFLSSKIGIYNFNGEPAWELSYQDMIGYTVNCFINEEENPEYFL